MGDYREAIAAAAGTGEVPVVSSTGRDGRHKYGFGVNAEQPLTDDGDTGLFPRLWAGTMRQPRTSPLPKSTGT